METNEKPLASRSSAEARIQSILDEHRSLAHSALDDLMYEAFLEVGQVLAEADRGSLTDMTETPHALSRCGLSDFALHQICHHTAAGDLAEWLAAGADGDKVLYLRDFLDLNRMQMAEFKNRHPRAFTKWTADQDEALMASYRQSAENGRQVPWKELSTQFGRNVNAIKLRLEKLGVDLGADAGRPRRPGGIV